MLVCVVWISEVSYPSSAISSSTLSVVKVSVLRNSVIVFFSFVVLLSGHSMP